MLLLLFFLEGTGSPEYTNPTGRDRRAAVVKENAKINYAVCSMHSFILLNHTFIM
jgi:hypothetical protein